MISRGTVRNNTGSFLILAHEKVNEINGFNASSGPTIQSARFPGFSPVSE